MIFNIDKLRKDLITKRLIDRRLSLREAAKEIDVSAATISRVENNKLPDVETFAKICLWLGTDAGSYFRVPVKRQDGIRERLNSLKR